MRKSMYICSRKRLRSQAAHGNEQARCPRFALALSAENRKQKNYDDNCYKSEHEHSQQAFKAAGCL